MAGEVELLAPDPQGMGHGVAPGVSPVAGTRKRGAQIDQVENVDQGKSQANEANQNVVSLWKVGEILYYFIFDSVNIFFDSVWEFRANFLFFHCSFLFVIIFCVICNF